MASKYGDWEVVSSLGEGGQAHTFRVRNIKDNREGVVKRLKNADSQARLQRFRHEAEAAKALDHPGIPRMLDLDLEDPGPYIVFEYRKGRNLEQYVEEKHSPLEILEIMLKVHEVMAYVHSKGSCHRDLKPKHVIIEENGHVGIIDFGLVYFENHARVTMVEEAVGSFRYMAPELEDGLGSVSLSCDVYSLGKMLYFALSGGREFNREKHRANGFNLVQIMSDQRYEQVNIILDRMINADPSGRYPNAGEVIPELRKAMDYFGLVEWERVFTIKEGELRQHGKSWTASGKGWFSNEAHENERWDIFGPYVIEPPLSMGLYEATYLLRLRGSGDGSIECATIDVATSAGGAEGSTILAARSLTRRDLLLEPKQPNSWRQHSLLFFYDGKKDVEFRLLRDGPSPLYATAPYATQPTCTLDFAGVRLRRLASLTPTTVNRENQLPPVQSEPAN